MSDKGNLFKDVEVGRDVRGLNIDDLIPDPIPDYVPNMELDPLIEFFLDCGANLGILGPPASGKTEGVIQHCALKRMPLLQQSAAADLTSADVRGAVMLSGDETKWIDGPLVTAMRIGGVYLLDEVTAADSAVLSCLFSVGDRRRTLYIAETGEMVKAHPNFRLMAAGNVDGAHVRQTMSDAFRSRFQIIISNDKHAMNVTSKRLSKLADVDMGTIVAFVKEVRNHGAQVDARDIARAASYMEFKDSKGKSLGPGESLMRALQGCSDDSTIRASVEKSIIARFGKS